MIDMDDLVGDPDFFQPMTVYRRLISYSAGQPVWTPTLIAPTPNASIQSGANPELLREADRATTANLITIYTDFRLACEGDTSGYVQNPEAIAATDRWGNQVLPAGAEQAKSDIVMYKGTPFEVFLVNDWTDYGNGFGCAIARQISSGQAGL